MKTRATITGNLTKDVEILNNADNKKYTKFTVAVNVNKETNFFVDCFLNYELNEEQKVHFTKGKLCTFVGKYSESVNVKDEKSYLNRVLNISDFYGSNSKNPFYKNMSVVLVGYLLDKPRIEEKQTTFVLTEKPFNVSGVENNSRFTCTLPYKLSDKALEKMINDASIYVYGYYDENMIPTINSLYIERNIEVKDFEILDRPINNINLGGLTK